MKKRKVIKQGQSLAITIPFKDAKEMNIKVGDEVVVEKVGKVIVIRSNE